MKTVNKITLIFLSAAVHSFSALPLAEAMSSQTERKPLENPAGPKGRVEDEAANPEPEVKTQLLTPSAVRAAQTAGTPTMEAQAIPTGPMGPGPGILGQRLFQRSVEEELRTEGTAKKDKDRK